MWYQSESNIKPTRIDDTSSKVYTYVRRNITETQREDETVYTYDECKIPKEVYGIFESQAEADSRLADVEATIAEIVGGGLV